MNNLTWAITESGYNSFELISALQKDIRRGNERQALFWAIQLERYNYRMLWRQLAIIASENVGLANPNIPVVIHTLKQQYYEAIDHCKIYSRNVCYRLFLANAILQLCRSRKSRIVDDFVWDVYWDYYNEVSYPIPDYAKKPHSCIGMSDDEFDIWYETVFRLENEDKEILNLYRRQAKENKHIFDFLPKRFPLKGTRRKKTPADVVQFFGARTIKE